MASTNNKKNPLQIVLTTKFCDCNKPKRSDVYEPKPNPKNLSFVSQAPINSRGKSNRSKSTDKKLDFNSSSTYTTQNSESKTDQYQKSSKILSPCPKIDYSFAEEKESKDPYKDFRDSMVQMIKEKEIASEEDLKELLKCYLELNSPRHHEIIIQAFKEIWKDAISRGFVAKSSHKL